MAHTWHSQHREQLSAGERLADAIAVGMGSWTFILAQTAFVIVWMALNLVGWMRHWDAYPFILLNLLFSTQAAYAAPIIMMSQNRQADRDRYQATSDYETNVKSEAEIEQVQVVLARIENEKLDRILKILEEKSPEQSIQESSEG